MVSTEFYPDLNVDNVWIYFGTGRYLNDTDKSSTESQYLYGIKDPFFNIRYEASLMHDYNAATGKTLSRADLFRGDTITVTTAGHVLQGGSLFGTGDLNSVVNVVRSNYDGWYHPLETHGTAASERCISRPSVIGGITFFPAFTPNEGACGQNGDTNFYGLYYLTGTAYTKQIFDVVATQISVTVNGNTNTEDVVAVKAQKALKGSPPPSAGIHAGAEKGGKAYLQMSTGEVVEIKFQTAIYFQSTITDWWDRLEQP
jgi:type IV pilus assembly protein PilY1